MTTIMITMVGIILAAAAALMMTWYGGGSFYSGTAKAEADRLLNAGANIRSATNVYFASRGYLPTSPADLLAQSAMRQAPELSGAGSAETAWRDLSVSGDTRVRKAWAVSGVKDSTCRYVNKNLIAANRNGILTEPEGLTGCYSDNGSNVFYAMLNDAATGGVVASGIKIPGTGSSAQDITDQIAWIKKLITAIPQSLPTTTDDTDITGIGSVPPGASGSWAQGVVTSLLYKPQGGKFGNTAYFTIYISQDPGTAFCQAWQNTDKPANVSNCDNYYFDHIVVHLR